MERGQVVILSVVVAALALFGLKVWSDRTADSTYDAAAGAAAERLARAGGMRADGSGSFGGSGGSGGEAGRDGGSMRSGGGLGGRIGSGPDGGRGNSAETARGGSRAGGSVVGSGSGGSRVAGGSAGGAAGGGDGPGIGPKVQQRDSLVEFLGSQPATQSDLASPEAAEGDVALQLDKVGDIDEQGGEGRNVEDAEDGDGIKITDDSDVQFPNNVNPEAATFSFRIQPEWAGSDQTDNALMQLRGQHEWSNRLELVKNGEFLRFILTDNTGREADISYRITDWVAGEEHEIRYGYGEGKTWLEVDGRRVGGNTYEGQLDFQQGVPLRVGGDWPGSNYQPANSTFKNLKITNFASDG